MLTTTVFEMEEQDPNMLDVLDCLFDEPIDSTFNSWTQPQQHYSWDYSADAVCTPRSDESDDCTLPPPSPNLTCNDAGFAYTQDYFHEGGCDLDEKVPLMPALDLTIVSPSPTLSSHEHLEPLSLTSSQAVSTPTRMSASTASTTMSPRLIAAPNRKRSVEESQIRRCIAEPSMEPEAKRGKKEKRMGQWDAHEDEALKHAVAKLGCKSWKRVSDLVPGRTHWQCSQRWQKVLQPGLIKGPWTAKEDAILSSMVESFSSSSREISWIAIAKCIPGRTAKQCRERYTLSLDPTICRGPWTEEEDKRICELHATFGNQWAKIKQHLPNRTENQIKSRHKTLQQAFAKDKSTKWTPQLVEKLNDLATQFDGDFARIRKHLPRELKGSSPQALMAKCSKIRRR